MECYIVSLGHAQSVFAQNVGIIAQKFSVMRNFILASFPYFVFKLVTHLKSSM
jgi:hypothetical protein